MSRKKSLFQTELDKRVSKADDGGKQRYTVEDEYAHIETTEGHLESSGIRSLRRGRKKSKFQIELDRLMSEAVEELQRMIQTMKHVNVEAKHADYQAE